ncbi:MAG: glycosyltransferase family 4 protein [Vicinamibacteria bacterium]|nr:glycosyltransferase family 4 protein [Vicinamibacteria bacterium]
MSRRVLICAAQAPFINGGAEMLVLSLQRELVRRGFLTEVSQVPFKWYPPEEIVRQALAWRLLDVTESNGAKIDLVIATKFPTFLAEHPCKVAWIFHQHREVYDLFGTEYCSFTDSKEHDEIKATIHSLDTKALSECRDRFTISRTVSDRLRKFNRLDSTPLYPPPPHVGRYRFEALGDFLLFAGRLDRLKRVDLLINALAHASSDVRLKIAGRGPLEGSLRELAERRGLSARVDFLGFVPDEDLLTLLAAARGVVYTPVNEDYGYVTLEAFLSGKTLITTHDAGGVLEFATTESGFIAEPTPESLGAAMTEAWHTSPARLKEMAEVGRKKVAPIQWDAVIDTLTETIPS